MRLQYKAAGLMIFIGVSILLLLTIFYSRQNRQVVLQKELQNIQNVSDEIAQHMDSHLKANATIANTLSSAVIIRNALLKSNAEFGVLSKLERKNEIDRRNNQWKETKDINDPFIQKHLTNPVAEFLKLQQIIQPGLYGEIFLTNRFGAMIASTGKLTTLAHAHKYWWKAGYHDGEGRIFFDDRGFDTSVDGYVIGVVVPVKNGDEIIGIMKCNINIMGPLTNIIQEYETRHPGKIQIVRTKGLIVAEKGKTPLSNSLHKDLIPYLQTKKVDTEFLERKTKSELVAFSPVGLTLGSEKFGFGGSHESIDHIKGNKDEAWYIVITLDEEIAIKDADETTRLLIMVGLIFIAVTSLIALFLGKWIAKPLVKLADATQKIGEGQLDTRITVATNDEIGTLAKEYNKMLENLKNIYALSKQAEEEILRNKMLLESSIESPKDMIILSLDRNYRYMYFNKIHAEAMVQVYGTKPQIGDCIFDQMKGKDDIEKVKSHYDRAIAGEGHVVIEEYGEDQLRFYYEIRYNPIIDDKKEIIGVTVYAQNITERKQTEAALERKTHDLGERVKELNCLYGISEFVERSHISLNEILVGIVNLIPPSWQYPDITCSRIIFEEKEYNSENYKETRWKQTSDIIVHGEKRGMLEVYYLEEKPEIYEGPFLKEERHLINEIGNRLGMIIERKQAEEQIKVSLKEKETLLHEIHHRVKNNMMVISSLLKLQADNMEDERLKTALMDSQNRVQSMSAIHETLYQSDNLSAVDIKTYLSSLAGAVAQNSSTGSKVNTIVESKNILIGSKQASPVGLIVNELITNTLKYAFPDNMDGEINISAEKTEDQIELEYSDNGVGIPEEFDWKNSNTLGLKLVRTLVENQLDGSIDLDITNGTKFIIKFNLET
jgi:PAS domain S-box-containing protein